MQSPEQSNDYQSNREHTGRALRVGNRAAQVDVQFTCHQRPRQSRVFNAREQAII